ncbi:CRISPR-associated protein Csx16 [Rhodovulum sulfidophilum]|uniref:CRISPR-associated protein Csx16 n=1 Tax=Rhodovulum sulfidophilum TaxID=35806 RepID=UPI000952A166|nr:CRISPR-associated protein Csx16 [Rhodovulum sulfidophilum]MBL3553145.1 CRISPR-associated protein Csx16 [Rhodovulum sulfidophilum]OLS50199.1 putative CRISPR-associated protein [Rhodovulum sulfidophilum]
MTAYFVTRHSGALDWAKAQGIDATPLSHLNPASIARGDTVIGSLPVHIAAEVTARGARYLHLSLDLPAGARGRELTAEEMARYGARLTEYRIKEADP